VRDNSSGASVRRAQRRIFFFSGMNVRRAQRSVSFAVRRRIHSGAGRLMKRCAERSALHSD